MASPGTELDHHPDTHQAASEHSDDQTAAFSDTLPLASLPMYHQESLWEHTAFEYTNVHDYYALVIVVFIHGPRSLFQTFQCLNCYCAYNSLAKIFQQVSFVHNSKLTYIV